MKYFFVVGEASGDVHAAAVMRELKLLDPEASFVYMGGPMMRAEGGDCILPSEDLAFMGIVDVVKNLKTIQRGADLVQQKLLEVQPDRVICVDYGSFCFRYVLPFVRKNLPNTSITYYIPPKVWAWKKGRIKTLRSHTDQVLTIFPFEVPYFEEHNLPQAKYVGNPTAEAVRRYLTDHPRLNPRYPSKYIAVLCGSRRSEIEENLPTMLRVANSFPDHDVLIAMAPGVQRKLYEQIILGQGYARDIDERIHLISGDTLGVARQANAALVTSGTATLETALMGCPQVVCYAVKGGGLANIVFNKFFTIPYISLVNLIAGYEVVHEMYGGLFEEEKIWNTLAPLLYDSPERQRMLEGYKVVSSRLRTDIPTATEVARSLL